MWHNPFSPKLKKDHHIHSVSTHARRSARNTDISPHVVGDPQYRRRSMCSVAVFGPSRPSLRVRTLRRHASFSRWEKKSLHEWYKELTVNLAKVTVTMCLAPKEICLTADSLILVCSTTLHCHQIKIIRTRTRTHKRRLLHNFSTLSIGEKDLEVARASCCAERLPRQAFVHGLRGEARKSGQTGTRVGF